MWVVACSCVATFLPRTGEKAGENWGEVRADFFFFFFFFFWLSRTLHEHNMAKHVSSSVEPSLPERLYKCSRRNLLAAFALARTAHRKHGGWREPSRAHIYHIPRYQVLFAAGVF